MPNCQKRERNMCLLRKKNAGEILKKEYNMNLDFPQIITLFLIGFHTFALNTA